MLSAESCSGNVPGSTALRPVQATTSPIPPGCDATSTNSMLSDDSSGPRTPPSETGPTPDVGTDSTKGTALDMGMALETGLMLGMVGCSMQGEVLMD